jgi:hypothetical protein
MAANAGPDIIEDGIVFYYDTDNTVKSFIGEPTTNQFTNSNFTNGTTGWTFGSWDGGRYLYSVENVLGPFGEIVPALKITRTSSDTSYAHFHQYNSGKYSNGNTYTLSAYVKGAGTLGQYNQGGFTPLNYNPGQFVTLNSTWQRVDYTLSSQTDSNYPYWAAENITQNVPMYFVFAQSELKTHPTQYTPSSRSVTQGLLDMTGNSTINITNVSFDSNAQIVFDGTNDYASLNTGILSGTGDFTVEAIIQSDYQETDGTIFANYPAGNLQTFFSGRYIGLWLGNASTYLGTSPWVVVLPEFTTNPIYFLAQREGTTTRLYLNGVLKKTGESNATIGDSSAAFRVGANTVGSEEFLGRIYVVRVYNRALTTSEVLTNYNALKTRFGI